METGIYIYAVIIVVAIIIYRRSRAGVVNLALTKFIFNPEVEDFLVIEGRKTGLWQWVLVQLKLGNRYQISANSRQISYSEDSARGNSTVLTPLAKISSTGGGFYKPIGALILSVVLAVFGVVFLFVEVAVGIIAILVAALLVVYYIYNKLFFINVQPNSGAVFGFSFKRSFIENVDIDVELITKSIAYLNEKMIETNEK